MCKAYDKIYLGDIVNLQGDVFVSIRDQLLGVDEKWFIETFMKSRIRKMLDHGNFKYVYKFPSEIINLFLEEEGRADTYKKGEPWWGFLPLWVGIIYAYCQWEFNIPSEKLVTILPLEEMERIFPALHQAGYSVAVAKIREEVLREHNLEDYAIEKNV